MKPRHYLLLGACAALAAGAWLVGRRSAGEGWARDPNQNVLLVTVDTLRADALGAYGGRAATPNLDRLAADGVRFEQAHAHAVVTLPSHTSILTGLYPFAHGVRDNAGYRVAPGARTLATTLKAAGYATGAFVGAFPLDSRWGLDQGFDEYDDGYTGTARLGDFRMPERRADAVVASAAAWIGRQTGRWFAWVHVYDPHAPYAPLPPFDRQYATDPYAGEVAYTDYALGPIFDRARSGPRPALIVVTADHGESLGAHGEETHGLFAYEETLHVPLILAATGRAHAFGPSPTRMPARHVDVLPTVLDAVGLQTPAALPGRSLVRAIEEGDSAPPASYFESLTPFLNRGWAPLTGIIVGDEKYIDLPIPELYDIRADPGETRNLVTARSERTRVLAARLRETAGTSPAAGAARVEESAEVRARLRALGYTAGSAALKEHYGEEDDPKRLVDLDRMMQEGVRLFQQGRGREALALYQDLVRRRPSMSAARLHAAYLQWELGDPAGAVAMLREGLRAGADAPDVRVQLGIYLAEAGSPREAIALLDPLRQETFPDLDGLNGLGIALARAGRQADALEVFDRVLELDPGNAAAYQNKGSVYLERGDLAKARTALEAALARDPDLPVALNGLGVVEIKSGRVTAGVEAWKRAVELDSRQYDTLYNLGVTLQESGDRTGARRYLEQFARTAPPAFYQADIAKVNAMLQRWGRERTERR